MQIIIKRQLRFIIAFALLLVANMGMTQAQTLANPSVTGLRAVCTGTGTTLTASGDNGATFAWYDAATGGNLLSSSAIYTTNNLTIPTHFYLQQTVGVITSARTDVYVLVNSLPSLNFPVGVAVSPSTICQGNSANLSANVDVTTGQYVYWYDAPIGGNLIGSSASGENFSVSPMASTTYYAQSQNQTFVNTYNYTGGFQTFTVPEGVSNITIDAQGGQGGFGGRGGRVQAIMNVTPGQVLNLYVGGAGTYYGGAGTASSSPAAYGGYNGGGAGRLISANGLRGSGGGGGATDIRLGQDWVSRILVAGGGGGGGYFGAGGTGGGLVGTNGTCSSQDCYSLQAGAGGTQTVGGVGGAGGGSSGAFGVGGQSSSSTAGGGGGGGWYGGGGSASGAGAGGGSSYANPAMFQNVFHTQGVRDGNGVLTISYNTNCGYANRYPVTVTVRNAGTVSGMESLCYDGTTHLYSSNGDEGGSWSSNNTAVATVYGGNTAYTQITAQSAGTANIIYTVGGCSAQKQITVYPLPQGSLIGVDTIICPGGRAKVIFNATSGVGPFTLIIREESYSGVISGTPFYLAQYPLNVTPNLLYLDDPYTLSSVTDANGCVRTSGFNRATVSLRINPRPIALPTSSNSICSGSTILLKADPNYYCLPDYTNYNSSYPGWSHYTSIGINQLALLNYEYNTPGSHYTTGSNNGTLQAGSIHTLSILYDINYYNIDHADEYYDAAAWIDYDGDEIFSETEKIVQTFNTHNNLTTSGNFHVPMDVSNGLHRVRVVTRKATSNGSVDPCSNLSISDNTTSGNTQDFYITIENASPIVNTGPPTYTWSPATFLSSTTGAQVIATAPTATTTYTVTSSNSFGCTASGYVTLNVNPLPTVTASQVIGCVGCGPIALSGTPAEGTWSVANPYSGSSTTYTHTYTDGFGCTNTSAPAPIIVNPIQTPVISGNLSFCPGSSTSLDAGAGYSGYLWSNGQTTQSITVNSPGTYYVNVNTNNPSLAAISANVIVEQLQPTITQVGDCITGGRFYGSGTPAAINPWVSSNPACVSVDNLGNYQVGGANQATITYTSTCGTASFQFNRCEYYQSNDTTVCNGDSITLPGSGNPASENPWVSSNTEIATVDDHGLVKGLAPGLAVISYYDDQGSLTTRNVTVNPTSYGTTMVQGCVSYEWASTGLTYTSSGTYFSAINENCFYEILELTILNPITWYLDADLDGYYVNTVQSCESPSEGYRTRGRSLGDCDDANNGIWRTGDFYTDADGDNYTVGEVQTLCYGADMPAGYSSNSLGTDCNDNNTNVNPGATEICNGIDDNCDGIVDFGPFGTPTSVNGPSAVCRTQSFVFTTDAVEGATSYQWTLPSNATGTSTSNSISVTFASTFTGGNICVKAVNQCGPSSQVCKTVTVITAASASPGTITGTTSACANSTEYTYTIAAVANASNYVWTAPSNATLVSGQGTTTATFSFQTAYTTGSISVKSSNCFGTSTARTLTVTKKSISATPGTVTGPASFCPGTQQTFSIAAVANASNYTWTAPANGSIVSGQGSLSVVVEFTSAFVSGNVSVVSSNCSGTSAVRTKSVTRTTLPGTVGIISGISKGACSSENRTYTIVAVSNTISYNWTAPANASILSGQGTTSVVVQFTAGFSTGTLSVKGVNCSGTSITARTLAITNVTSTPSILSGSVTAVCAGSTQTYSTTAVTGATSYVWSVPAGAVINGASNGTSISVTFPIPFTSGVVSVKSATACYTSSAKSLTISSVVSQPSSITGTSTNLCSGGSFTYSIPAVTGATGYSWNVPAGWIITANSGTSITVSIPTTGFTSASISVAAQNACGFGTARSLTLSALPSAPTAIIGSNSVCPSATGLVYSTPAIVGATSFTWTISTGATITSGQGTNSIVVNWGTSAGTVSVKAKNICGTNNTARTLAVGLIACRLGEEVAEETTVEAVISSDLRVYPNPTIGNATVVFGSEIGGKYTINVLNTLGQVMNSKSASSTTGENTHAIDISELSSGLYFINLMEESGMRSLRLVKR